MNKSFGCSRYIYNYCLDLKTKSYQTEKKSLSQFDLCKLVVIHKKEKEWLSEVDHQTLCCSVQNLDKAYTKFFRDKKGFPKFKSKHNSKQSCQFTQGVKIDFENSKIRFPKIGYCNLFLSRIFEGKIKTVTVSRNAVGYHFASILVETADLIPIKKSINESTAIGIDVGIKDFATLSTGDKIQNPKYYEGLQKRLSVMQRRSSRKQKGSANRKKSNKKVAKLHYRISNLRNDFLHKLSTKIVRENQTIIVENLNVEGMLKNHNLAKSISSVSWATFFNYLKYKSEWNGCNYVEIGRFEPSSKLCTCGFKNAELKLSDREWTCKSCGVTHNRDILAAQNIKRFGLDKQNLITKTSEGIRVEPVELLTLVGTMKQEKYFSVN